MKNVNIDLHAAAENHDSRMLENICEYGAWTECTLQDDPMKDTALHRCVLSCADYLDFVSEAERLQMIKLDDTKDYLNKMWKPVGSKLKRLVKTEYQKDKLTEEIRVWHERRNEAMKCLGWLCLLECDPRLCNAEGQTVLDLCATKHPEVQDHIRRQWEWMDKRDVELEEAAADPEYEMRMPRRRDKNTGLYERDRFFMHEYFKAKEKSANLMKKKMGGWAAKGLKKGKTDETAKA